MAFVATHSCGYSLFTAGELTALKISVFHKRVSIFQLKLQNYFDLLFCFNLFLCLKHREHSKITIDTTSSINSSLHVLSANHLFGNWNYNMANSLLNIVITSSRFFVLSVGKVL